jgi:hypothetical protein
LVHDAVGTVVNIEFHPAEEQGWSTDPDHEARSRGYVVLSRLPLAVYVRFDDFQEDLGAGVGVVPIEPHKSDWVYKTHERGTGRRLLVELRMSRRQIPLAPEKVRTVYVQRRSRARVPPHQSNLATTVGDRNICANPWCRFRWDLGKILSRPILLPALHGDTKDANYARCVRSRYTTSLGRFWYRQTCRR